MKLARNGQRSKAENARAVAQVCESSRQQSDERSEEQEMQPRMQRRLERLPMMRLEYSRRDVGRASSYRALGWRARGTDRGAKRRKRLGTGGGLEFPSRMALYTTKGQ